MISMLTRDCNDIRDDCQGPQANHAMNHKPVRPQQDTGSRQARLRDALRENLKRRKLQARGRAAQEPGEGESGDVQHNAHGDVDKAN